MSGEPTPEQVARAIIDDNRYMTIATADSDGRPWASPVYFTPVAYRDFYWVSVPTTRHSVNIAERPEVGIVVFDSTVEVGDGQGVYIEALATEVDDADIEELVDVAFSPRFPGVGGFAPHELRAPSSLRLYRASASTYSILKPRSIRAPGEYDNRIEVALP